MNRILLLGASGLLGSEVLRQLHSNNENFIAPTSIDLDIRDKAKLKELILDFKPNWIINCVAWTNVEGAEDSYQAALDLNEGAVRNIAESCKETDCRIIHISTDYVFDGTSPHQYGEGAKVNPLNKYGESKMRGEKVLQALSPSNSYIIRTSWLYGVQGKNFVKTIAEKALNNSPVRVVSDQLGSPTSARDLASAIFSVIDRNPKFGIYHFSNNGHCSWYDLATAIYDGVGSDSELVEAVTTDSLNFKAKRPQFSVFDKKKWASEGLSEIQYWKTSLFDLLPEIVTKIQTKEK
jgi:dTDP-4-dehydrorhamnose reductase